MMTVRINSVLFLASVISAVPNRLMAATATFGFEGVAATVDKTNVGSHVPTLSTLTTTDQGLDFTLTRDGGLKFDIFDVAGINSDDALPHFPGAFGTRCVNVFQNETATSGFAVGNLSAAVSSAALDYVIFAGTETVTLTGYSGPNGTGSVIATGVSTLTAPVVSNAALGSVSIAGIGIRSVTVSGVNVYAGGTPTFNPGYLDNFSFTTTPEPTSVSATVLAYFGLGRRTRRR